MAIYNRVKVATATTGTGTVTLGSAASGFQTFASAGVPNAGGVSYVIEDGTAWEIGTGVYTTSGTTMTRVLVASSTGSLLSLSGAAVVYIAPSATDNPVVRAPLVTVHASSSGTHTTAAGCLYMTVEMVGGGSGGGGSGSGSPGKGTAGGNTTFGTSLLTANGGAINSTSIVPGNPGTATGGDINITGQKGTTGLSGYTNSYGGLGGGTPLGIGGESAGQGAGLDGAGYGAGGGGAGTSGVASPGTGGSAGGYLRKLISSLLSTYAWAVGAAGSAGTAGTSGAAGGAGAPGVIIITEYFN